MTNNPTQNIYWKQDFDKSKKSAFTLSDQNTFMFRWKHLQ